jgi:MraZ protein|tara:strand:+ start:258 stop:728 length:471 start_codon:yes stop_codon:yes gene_type:complete
MALFLSTIQNKIDSKSRVSVPSTFRNSLNKLSFKGIIAFPSYSHQSIDACGIDRMEALANSIDDESNYSKEEFELISLYFSEAEEIPFDKDGRIILPKKLLDHADISKNALFVGLGPTFQIWNPDLYEKQKVLTIKIAKEKKLNPRLKPIPKGILE